MFFVAVQKHSWSLCVSERLPAVKSFPVWLFDKNLNKGSANWLLVMKGLSHSS